jgi:hypothetical protein
MNRDALIGKLAQTGDDRKAMVVDLGGSAVDIEDVYYDTHRNCVVLKLDLNDLEGALRELMERVELLP